MNINNTNQQQPNNLLNGVNLADILKYLVKEYGWEELVSAINIRCFNFDPSIKSMYFYKL